MNTEVFAIGPQSTTEGFRATKTGQVTASNVNIRGTSEIAGFKITNSGLSGAPTIESPNSNGDGSGFVLSNLASPMMIFSNTGSSVADLTNNTDGGVEILSVGNTIVPSAGVSPLISNKVGISYVRTHTSGNSDGKIFFRLDEDVKTIANWSFDEEKIFSHDAVSEGVTIHSKQGLIGHGDENSRTFKSHAGQFLFTEDTISSPGGSGGATYDDSNFTLNNYDGNSGPGQPDDYDSGTP